MTATADRHTVATAAGDAGASPTRSSTAKRVPSWWQDVVGSLTWASVLVVVAIWVAGGGVQSLGALASGLTGIGRLAGLVAANLMLVQVLLMARIPVVERVYGQDELARRHRLVGFTSVNLMVAHIVLVTLGYAVQDHLNPVAQGWDLVATYPGVLLAVAGAGLLGMVTVASIRKARRRLRYESWHLLHLYAYLGVGLAVPHQLWTGQEFVSSPLATLYWWALWVAAAGAVLVWRVGMPVYRTLVHGLRVSSVVHEGPGVISVWMTGRRLHRLPAAAGQFFIWRFFNGPGWSRGRPVLPVRSADRRYAADYHQGPRRRERRGRQVTAWNAGGHRRPLRAPACRRPQPAEGHAAGRRRRHHPAARAPGRPGAATW
ncbi:MAG: ferric reductase-like transmembrane domain-containing protein [Dermatophilaceae bacterium]